VTVSAREKKTQKKKEFSSASSAKLHFFGFFFFSTRYSAAFPNLRMLDTKKISFSLTISKVFVSKTAQKRKTPPKMGHKQAQTSGLGGFLSKTPGIFGWLCSELYLGSFRV
jgi:hypothetical protein